VSIVEVNYQTKTIAAEFQIFKFSATPNSHIYDHKYDIDVDCIEQDAFQKLLFETQVKIIKSPTYIIPRRYTNAEIKTNEHGDYYLKYPTGLVVPLQDVVMISSLTN